MKEYLEKKSIKLTCFDNQSYKSGELKMHIYNL